jgi:agmatinase
MILNIVLCAELIHTCLSTGCDIVEVTPAYDHAEMTSRAAAGIVDDFLQMLQADAPPKPRGGPFWDDDDD